MQTGTKGTYAKNRAIKVRVSNLTKYYGDLLVLDNVRPGAAARPPPPGSEPPRPARRNRRRRRRPEPGPALPLNNSR